MPKYQLTQGIVELSEADSWEAAKMEWVLDEVYESEEPDTCLCNHYPIIEVCVLRNSINGNKTIVGNCCVKRFIGLPSDKIFQAVKRVRKDNEKSLNSEAIHYAFEKKWINDWEKSFYIDVMRKRKLSTKQLEKKIQINKKMTRNMKKSRSI